MNQSLKDPPFEFDSHFESGNLDLVVQIGENEYNLFLRPDTNTCGHMQWFYFTVKNKQKGKIKMNICNNRKAKTLFARVLTNHYSGYETVRSFKAFERDQRRDLAAIWLKLKLLKTVLAGAGCWERDKLKNIPSPQSIKQLLPFLWVHLWIWQRWSIVRL